MKKNQLIQYNVKIKTCTPVHIGNGFGAIEKYQYIYEPEKKILSFIDEHKWIELITRKRLWSQYQEYVRRDNRNVQSKSIPSLIEWLRECRVTEQEIASVIRSKANVYTEKLDQESLNKIQPLIAQADGRLYIPGSTIKGFVRSAILHHIIRQNRSAYRRKWDELKQNIRSGRKRDIERSIGNIEYQAFTTLTKIEQKVNRGKPRPQRVLTASAMRGILISDAIATKPRSETPTVLVKKIDVSPNLRREHPLPIFRECIAPNTEFTATITLDLAMTRTIGINSLADLEKILYEYLRFAYAKQKEIFTPKYAKTFQNAESANLSLGGGTGFHTKTLIRSLAKDEGEARILIERILEKNFEGEHVNDKIISPRTLKITRMGAQAEFMGICTLTEA